MSSPPILSPHSHSQTPNLGVEDMLKKISPSPYAPPSFTSPRPTSPSNQTAPQPQPTIYKFVLTGGPCAGKTTAISRLSNFLKERNYTVLTVPEAATLMFTAGLQGAWFGDTGWGFQFQFGLLTLQMSLEDTLELSLRGMAPRAGERGRILLCDRGLMDGKSYMNDDEWKSLLRCKGIEDVCLSSERYNAIFHLVTAANGAPAFYTLLNNLTRTETIEEAIETDLKTQSAWLGHPQHHIISNKGVDFEGKLQRLINIVSGMVGLPIFEREGKKFLLEPTLSWEDFAEVEYQVFEIEKVYLYDESTYSSSSLPEDPNQIPSKSAPLPSTTPNEFDANDIDIKETYSFLRKRTLQTQTGTPPSSSSTGLPLNPSTSYGLTTVNLLRNGREIELKRIIGEREYNDKFKNRDKDRHIIKQKRVSFLWDEKSFNIHIYERPVERLCVLHFQGNLDKHEGDEKALKLPPFLRIKKEIELGGEEGRVYGAHYISLKTNGKSGLEE